MTGPAKRAPRALALTAVLALTGAAAACGSRVADDKVSAAVPAAPTYAPSPAVVTTPPARAAASAAVGAPATSTTGPTSAPATTAAPTTAAPARSVASSTPPVLDPNTVPTTTVAAPPTTSATDKAAFCAASKVYSIDDLVGLGSRVVGDPTGLLAAYDTMIASAPADLAAPVRALEPITRQTVDLVRRGQITTPEQLQRWLADSAPRADLEQWVRAQQVIVPEMKAICS